MSNIGKYTSVFTGGYFRDVDIIAIDIQAKISQVLPSLGDTIKVTGKIVSSLNCNIQLDIEVYNNSNVKVGTMHSATHDLVFGDNKIGVLASGDNIWKVIGSGSYYIKITVSSGSTTINSDYDTLPFYVHPQDELEGRVKKLETYAIKQYEAGPLFNQLEISLVNSVSQVDNLEKTIEALHRKINILTSRLNALGD